MPSPFPGMDPYLEDPDLWSGFHTLFLVAILNQLLPRLRPKYFVRVEERVYLSDDEDPGRHFVPDVQVTAFPAAGPNPLQTGTGGLAIAESIPVVDLSVVEVSERRLEIRDHANRSVVTVIELLSPTNKMPGSRGRESFLQKRRDVYATPTHWMEIDLLRDGVRTANHAPAAGTPYQAYLSRSRGDRRRGSIWPIALEQALPVIGVPLLGTDADIPLDLQAAFEPAYEQGSYEFDLDFMGMPPPPKMSPEALAWCRERIDAHQSSSP